MQGNRRSMFIVFAAVGSGQLHDRFLKMGFDRPRPDLVPHGSYRLHGELPERPRDDVGGRLPDAGDPRRAGADRRRVRVYLIVFACFLAMMVGVSRVYLGVHWPSDVLAGWTAGAAWAVVGG